MTTQSRPWRMPWPFSKTTPTISPPSVSRSDFGELLQTPDYFQARCFFFLGQFEKSLLVWTQANRIRTNNKEVTKSYHMYSHAYWLDVFKNVPIRHGLESGYFWRKRRWINWRTQSSPLSGLHSKLLLTMPGNWYLVIHQGYLRSTAQPINILWEILSSDLYCNQFKGLLRESQWSFGHFSFTQPYPFGVTTDIIIPGWK